MKLRDRKIGEILDVYMAAWGNVKDYEEPKEVKNDN